MAVSLYEFIIIKMDLTTEIIDEWRYLVRGQEDKTVSVQRLAVQCARIEIKREEVERWLAVKKSRGEIDMQYIASNCYIIPINNQLINSLSYEQNT